MLLVRLHIDYIDLLKLKAYNCLKLVMLTSPGFFFKEANFFAGSGLVRFNSVLPWDCSSYVIVKYFDDYNRSKLVTDLFDKLDLKELLSSNIQCITRCNMLFLFRNN